MTEVEIDLTNGEEDSVVIYIRLHEPCGDVDVFEVTHAEDRHYFEADTSCDALDVIALAIETIREDQSL